MTGRLRRIFLRPSARTPVKQVERAVALPGAGLEGDHAGGGNRQVTLMSEEAWRAACADLDRPDLSPGLRRANLVVEGVDLASAVGKVIEIASCRIQVIAETRPCRLMDDAAPGLQHALDPDRRGGVYGRVLEAGPVAVGDLVIVRTEPQPQGGGPRGASRATIHEPAPTLPFGSQT